MKGRGAMKQEGGDGKRLLQIMAALDNPHRLRIIAQLTNGRTYVSQLARDVGISRPLLIMHLQRLESAGLVSSTLELSQEGKAVRYYSVEPFELHLTPTLIADAVRTLKHDLAASSSTDENVGEKKRPRPTSD